MIDNGKGSITGEEDDAATLMTKFYYKNNAETNVREFHGNMLLVTPFEVPDGARVEFGFYYQEDKMIRRRDGLRLVTTVDNSRLGELEYGGEYDLTEDVWTQEDTEVADAKQDIIFVAAKSSKSKDEKTGTYTW